MPGRIAVLDYYLFFYCPLLFMIRGRPKPPLVFLPTMAADLHLVDNLIPIEIFFYDFENKTSSFLLPSIPGGYLRPSPNHPSL